MSRTTNPFDFTPTQASVELVEQLRARSEEISKAIYAHIQISVPDPISDANPAYQQGMHHAIITLLGYTFAGIAAGGRWEQPIPSPAIEQARRSARADVSLGLIIRRYVAAHACLGEYIVEQSSRCGISGDPATLHHLRRTQEALLEHLTATIELEYTKESERLGRSPFQRRALIVRRLLRHEPVDQVELAELAYALEDGWHVGIVAAGPTPEQAVDALKRGLRCEVLTVTDEGAVWAWLGTKHKISAKRVNEYLSTRSPVRLAIGEPRFGVDGWRRTHREALAAWPIALTGDSKAVHCADVTLDAALLANDVLVKLHQETYLVPLDSLRGGGQTARETLDAYFSCDGSIASTSAKLSVTRRTVENRLQVIAKSLRRPLRSCLPEIEVALRVEALVTRRTRPDERDHASKDV